MSSDTSAQPYWGMHIYARIHEALDRPVSAQSERDMYKSSVENLFTTCADRLLDNHVVISEHHKP